MHACVFAVCEYKVSGVIVETYSKPNYTVKNVLTVLLLIKFKITTHTISLPQTPFSSLSRKDSTNHVPVCSETQETVYPL